MTLSGCGRVQVVRFSDVKPEPVEWLWNGRIPLSMLSEVVGDPGLGKSTLVADIGARLTRGDAMPDGSPGPEPAGVVILSAEDDLARVTVPRVLAAGANPDLVTTLRLSDADGELREPTLSARDLEEAEQAVRDERARLVIFDPFMAYLPPDVDAHRDQDVRRPLSALRGLAERTGAAVVIVRHLNKSPGGSPLYRPGGSIGITAAVRAGHLLARDPAGASLVFAPTKSSLAPMPKPLGLSLVADPGAKFPRVVWQGECEHSAASLLAPPPVPERRSELSRAEDFLRELLALGPVAAKDAERAAGGNGISERTLARARRSLGVLPRKLATHWEWALSEGRQSAEGSQAGGLGSLGTLALSDAEEGRQERQGHHAEGGGDNWQGCPPEPPEEVPGA